MKTGKEFYDELATIYSIAAQSIGIHEDKASKIQQIAACSALFAMKLAKTYGLKVADAAPHIAKWITQLEKSGQVAVEGFKKAPIPAGVEVGERSEGRRQGGIDYTTKAVIHKVIDPLFLDDLNAEFDKIVDDMTKGEVKWN